MRASTPLSRATVRFHRFTDGSDGAWAADSRAYLITQTARDSVSDSRISLVTIIPHPNHMREGELDSLDFFDMRFGFDDGNGVKAINIVTKTKDGKSTIFKGESSGGTAKPSFRQA